MKEFLCYSPGLEIQNLESTPRGTGAKFLECIRDHKGGYIAKRWRRTPPADYEVLIAFLRRGDKSSCRKAPPA